MNLYQPSADFFLTVYSTPPVRLYLPLPPLTPPPAVKGVKVKIDLCGTGARDRGGRGGGEGLGGVGEEMDNVTQ